MARPCSVPPYTKTKYPCRINGSRIFSFAQLLCSITGLHLYTTTELSLQSASMMSLKTSTFPAPRIPVTEAVSARGSRWRGIRSRTTSSRVHMPNIHSLRPGSNRTLQLPFGLGMTRCPRGGWPFAASESIKSMPPRSHEAIRTELSSVASATKCESSGAFLSHPRDLQAADLSSSVCWRNNTKHSFNKARLSAAGSADHSFALSATNCTFACTSSNGVSPARATSKQWDFGELGIARVTCTD
mmetsp:Transcript_172263/g.552233  ORF Transcript_172263/g.552233 Transcript_172263/m.552233 type:complete len:243 (-) Transcript_172263:30-758(-)